jgi:hypothetical protein
MKASTQNYFDKSKQEKRETIREKLLSCFKDVNVWTSFELQMHLGYKDLTTVSRRLAELENDGLIFQTMEIEIVNGNSYAIYKLTPSLEIEEKRYNRWKSRRIDWLQQGVNFGYITKDEKYLLLINEALKSE